MCQEMTFARLNNYQYLKIMSKKTQQTRKKQLEVTASIIEGFQGATQLGCLREAIKQKERAIKGLFDILEGHIMPMRHCGLSVVSVAHVGEEIMREMKMQSEMMEQYASRLAAIMPDLAKSYNGVSSRIISEADRILAPVLEEAEKATQTLKVLEAQEFISLI